MLLVTGALNLQVTCDSCGKTEMVSKAVSTENPLEIGEQLFAQVEGDFSVTEYVGNKKKLVLCDECENNGGENNDNRKKAA